MVQCGDRADKYNPSRQRQKWQGKNFGFIGAGFEQGAIVPASGEAAQKSIGVNAGVGVDEHVGFVAAGRTQLQLTKVKPPGDRVGFRRRIDRTRCRRRVNGVRVRRVCFRFQER